MQQILGCILIDKYVTPAALSPGPEVLSSIFRQNAQIFKMPSLFSLGLGFFILSLSGQEKLCPGSCH